MYKNIWNIWIDLVDFSARSTATGGLSNTDRLFKNGFGFTVLGLIFDIFYFLLGVTATFKVFRNIKTQKTKENQQSEVKVYEHTKTLGPCRRGFSCRLHDGSCPDSLSGIEQSDTKASV